MCSRPMFMSIIPALILVLGMLLGQQSLADPASAPPATAATEPAPAPGADMTVEELIDTIVAVVTDWRTAGWLAGLVALINLLLQLLRLPALDRFLERYGLKWCKPALAAILGGLLTALLAYRDGDAVGGAALAGGIVGLSATGLYELVNRPLAALRAPLPSPPPLPRRGQR